MEGRLGCVRRRDFCNVLSVVLSGSCARAAMDAAGELVRFEAILEPGHYTGHSALALSRGATFLAS